MKIAARASCPRRNDCLAGPRGPCRCKFGNIDRDVDILARHNAGETYSSIGKRYGLARTRVSCIARAMGGAPRGQDSAAKAARARHLFANPVFKSAHVERSREGMKKLFASPAFAAAHAERARERMKKLHADPTFAAAQSERMRKQRADPKFIARLNEGLRAARERRNAIEIPAWVHADDRDKYRQIARSKSEEDAASHCRRLKREREAGRASR